MYATLACRKEACRFASLPPHDATCTTEGPSVNKVVVSAGLFVGIISPVQQLFYSSRVGDQDVAPLAFIAAGLNILGGAAIPSTMLVRLYIPTPITQDLTQTKHCTSLNPQP